MHFVILEGTGVPSYTCTQVVLQGWSMYEKGGDIFLGAISTGRTDATKNTELAPRGRTIRICSLTLLSEMVKAAQYFGHLLADYTSS